MARPTDGQPARGVFLDTGRCGLDRLPPGSRVLTDGGLHRVEPDGTTTPLEAPEVAPTRHKPDQLLTAEKLADGSEVRRYPDARLAVHRMNANHVLALAAATGELTRLHEDGTEERLPPDPDAVYGGVRGRDAIRARQQLRAAALVHARATADTVSPAVVRRTPAARPAARRPRASAKRTAARDGPDDEGEAEPASRGPAPSPRFSRPWRRADGQLTDRTAALDRLGLVE